MRENVFTMFAKSINAFCQHKLTKEELFDRFIECIEIADKSEKNERVEYEKSIKEWRKLSIVEMAKKDKPYSNIETAKEILQK